ncbi:MAG: GTP-binding protein [Arthrospira sp. PLM2.Bin9]|nr:Rab family GTPase [Arthrospira sp. PLM2.Bin9]TVU52261.1 MAG: GTP-binding protein [Arthrospira sp. PLM2.Bin9]
MSKISKKMCMVGDFSVGKTSLIRRFVDGQFSDQYLSTVGVKISRKAVDLPNVKPEEIVNLQLLIWDIEGHTKFKAIAPSYLQGAGGVILVADLSRQETIERLIEHLNLFLSVNPKGEVIVALNKADLVAEKDLEKLTKYVPEPVIEKALGIYPTSAKTGDYVDEIFQKLSYSMVVKV